MNADARPQRVRDTRRLQPRGLEDARRRLLTLAGDLTPESATEAALRKTAGTLEGVVRRIRWLADVSGHESGLSALPTAPPSAQDDGMRTVDRTSALERLSREECVALMAEEEVGRLVVADGGPPLVFPVNYALDGEAPVFRTASGTKLWAATRGPVAFEVDHVDRKMKAGWSVVVHGIAQEVTAFDGAELQARVAGLPVMPWAPGDKPSVVRIQPRLITGRRIAE